MLSSTDLVQAVTADLEKIRETAPLVLSLTNSVVQPLTANLLLAIGAVPAMLNDAEEAVDMLRSGTGALLVNLGTVTREMVIPMPGEPAGTMLVSKMNAGSPASVPPPPAPDFAPQTNNPFAAPIGGDGPLPF